MGCGYYLGHSVERLFRSPKHVGAVARDAIGIVGKGEGGKVVDEELGTGFEGVEEYASVRVRWSISSLLKRQLRCKVGGESMGR